MRIALFSSFIVVNMLLPVVVSEDVPQAARIISTGKGSWEDKTLTWASRPFSFVMGQDGVEMILKTKKDGKLNGYQSLKDVGYTNKQIQYDVDHKMNNFMVFFYDMAKGQMVSATWENTVQLALKGYTQLKPFSKEINEMVAILESPDKTIKYVREKIPNAKRPNQAYIGDGADTLNALQYIKLLNPAGLPDVRLQADGLVKVLKGAKKMDLLFAVRAFLWYGCGCTELYGGKGYTLQTTGTDSDNRKVVKKTLQEYLVPNNRLNRSKKMFGGWIEVTKLEVEFPSSQGAPGTQGKEGL